MARKRGPMGTDESVRTYYAIELGGKVWNLGYSIPEELKIPTKDEELEIERALKKLTERERKLLKIDL